MRDDRPVIVLPAEHVGRPALVQETPIPPASGEAKGVGANDDVVEESCHRVGELPFGDHAVRFGARQELLQPSWSERSEVTHIVALGIVGRRHFGDDLGVPLDPSLPPAVNHLECGRVQIRRLPHTPNYTIRVPSISVAPAVRLDSSLSEFAQRVG